MTVTATALRRVEHCLGTAFSLDICPPLVDPASVAEVIAWLHKVDATFSTLHVSRRQRAQLARTRRRPTGTVSG